MARSGWVRSGERRGEKERGVEEEEVGARVNTKDPVISDDLAN